MGYRPTRYIEQALDEVAGGTNDKVDGQGGTQTSVLVKGCVRFPHVVALTVLPTNIAAWFSHFRWPQEDEFDFAVVFRSLLFDPRRIESLSEFVTLLGGGDVADELVRLTNC